jgi:hypothetical protein
VRIETSGQVKVLTEWLVAVAPVSATGEDRNAVLEVKAKGGEGCTRQRDG